ncbi:DDE_3 domain-containing protein [Trichonephila clavipes]|nr:DDE_3 domain-containing protein [Trichonephila clavipes]
MRSLIHMAAHIAAIGNDFILMNDKCTTHRAGIVEEYLEDHGLERMEWPARSPDLNPIEHDWDYLGREVAALNPHPKSLHELKQGLICVWSCFPIPVRRHGEVVLEVRRLQKPLYIVLSAKRNRHTTAQQVANQFLAASESRLSRKTVARRLTGGGFIRTQTCCVVPLTRQHRTARFAMVSGASQLTELGWARVLFSDKSRFSLSSDCRRQLIWAREWYCLSSRKYPGKGPISDVQYHGVGRHLD